MSMRWKTTIYGVLFGWLGTYFTFTAINLASDNWFIYIAVLIIFVLVPMTLATKYLFDMFDKRKNISVYKFYFWGSYIWAIFSAVIFFLIFFVVEYN